MTRTLISLLLSLIAFPLLAQNAFPVFTVSAGAYRPDYATDIRANNTILAGTQINAERDLGLQQNERLQRFAATWRPLRRHELSGSYFKSDRSGFRQIDNAIVFNGVVYPAQAQVTSGVALRYWDATYTGWIARSDRAGVGLSLGAAGLAVDASLFARRPGQTLTITETASTKVPVALIGAQVRGELLPRLIAEASGGVLPRVHIDVYSGRALTANARVEYRVVRYLGVGVAYNYFNIAGNVIDPQFSGDLDLTIKGAEGYVRLVL